MKLVSVTLKELNGIPQTGVLSIFDESVAELKASGSDISLTWTGSNDRIGGKAVITGTIATVATALGLKAVTVTEVNGIPATSATVYINPRLIRSVRTVTGGSLISYDANLSYEQQLKVTQTLSQVETLVNT